MAQTNAPPCDGVDIVEIPVAPIAFLGAAPTGADADAERAPAAVEPPLAAARAPLARTRRPSAEMLTSTVPSRSVRYARRAIASSRAIVAGAGWPYVFPRPADATATLGRTASRKASVVAVLDPWWATLSRSTD